MPEHQYVYFTEDKFGYNMNFLQLIYSCQCSSDHLISNALLLLVFYRGTLYLDYYKKNVL